MICYELTLGGLRSFDVQITLDRSRLPQLEVRGFGEHRRESLRTGQTEKLHAQLVQALQVAGIPLPGHCCVTGPGGEYYSPGLPLALLMQISDLCRGETSANRYAWGDLVDGEARPAAGEVAVATALADGHVAPVEFVVPRPYSAPVAALEVLGEISNLRPSMLFGRDLLRGMDRAYRLQIHQHREPEPMPLAVSEPPDAVKLALEVAIAGRLPAVLVGHELALGDWRSYAQQITPALPTGAALRRAAMLSLWGAYEFEQFRHVPAVHVGPADDFDALAGELDLAAPDKTTGKLARAHQGLLLVEQADRVSELLLARINADVLRYNGEELRPEYTLICSMRGCLCNPPPGTSCRCKMTAAAETVRIRKHVASQLRRTVVWASSDQQLDVRRDFSPAAVRERIALAWSTWPAPWVGGNELTRVYETLGNLDGSELVDHQRLTWILTERPW